MEKKWQILPAAPKSFFLENPDLSAPALQIIYNRGPKSAEEIKTFLNLSYDQGSFDPLLFEHMEEGVDMVIEAIKKGEKICIYGDYDADGVTSSALLKDVIGTLLGEVEIYLPDRVSEGYGLNKKALGEMAENGISLVITVDNGVRNKAEVEYALEKGLKVIITDHHAGPKEKSEYPNCPIINPSLEIEKYPFKLLAGVGVAFKFAEALIDKSKLDEETKNKLKRRCLDLVAIGTIADCSQLVGENRALVKSGLESLNKTARLGLIELETVAGINGKELDSWNVSFQLAPRLNAAGRVGHANTALELLLEKDQEKAKKLAEDLNDKNSKRQRITEEAVREIESKHLPKIGSDDRIAIAVSPNAYESGEGWMEGIVGLAAGRITEHYYLPALVITVSEKEGVVKGSGRSIEEFNIIKAVEECSALLMNFGGHPAACGFSLKMENLEAFKTKMKEIAKRELGKLSLAPRISVDVEVDLAEADDNLAREINKFAPFGEGNPRPSFVSRNVFVVDVFRMGSDNQHLRFKIKSDYSGVKSALAFGQANKWGDFKTGDRVDIVYSLEMNNFNGREEAQLKIIDIKYSSKD